MAVELGGSQILSFDASKAIFALRSGRSPREALRLLEDQEMPLLRAEDFSRSHINKPEIAGNQDRMGLEILAKERVVNTALAASTIDLVHALSEQPVRASVTPVSNVITESDIPLIVAGGLEPVYQEMKQVIDPVVREGYSGQLLPFVLQAIDAKLVQPRELSVIRGHIADSLANQISTARTRIPGLLRLAVELYESVFGNSLSLDEFKAIIRNSLYILGDQAVHNLGYLRASEQVLMLSGNSGIYRLEHFELTGEGLGLKIVPKASAMKSVREQYSAVYETGEMGRRALRCPAMARDLLDPTQPLIYLMAERMLEAMSLK